MAQPAPEITSREVSWPFTINSHEYTIHGTVTEPALQSNPKAAVVLVCGGGPTDRDWCSPTLPGSNGSGRLMAETLARQGYVTLRCEKLAFRLLTSRVTEEEKGAKVTLESSWGEIAGAAELIRREYGAGRENALKIFAMGNSEGTVHVVNYQLEAVREVRSCAIGYDL